MADDPFHIAEAKPRAPPPPPPRTAPPAAGPRAPLLQPEERVAASAPPPPVHKPTPVQATRVETKSACSASSHTCVVASSAAAPPQPAPPSDPFAIACAPQVAFTPAAGASSGSASYSASCSKRACATTSTRTGGPAPDVTVYAAPAALPHGSKAKGENVRTEVVGRELEGWDVKADMDDLALDGKHWREQFGGGIGDGPQMGAFVFFGPMAFVIFRLIFALGAGFIFGYVLVPPPCPGTAPAPFVSNRRLFAGQRTWHPVPLLADLL